MKIQKTVPIKNSDCICIAYNENYFGATDTSVIIYDKYKISILLTDDLCAVVNNKIINSGKNSVLFFRPDEHHFGHFTKSGKHSYIDFLIPDSFFEKFHTKTENLKFLSDDSETRINYISTDILIKKKVSELAKETFSLLSSDDPLCNTKLLSLTLQIILLCENAYENQKETPLNNEIPAIVTKVLNYISENYAQKISLNTLAEICNCSVTYLSKTFKKHTGTTIYNHITATRIANAQIILKSGATVTETCFASGFEDCSNFIRTFKKITGKTPYSYKTDAHRDGSLVLN